MSNRLPNRYFPKIVVGCPWLVLTLISFLYAVITTLWIIKFVDLLVLTATPQGLFWKWNDCLCFSACQTETLSGVEALITTAVSHISLFNRQQRRDNIIATDGLRRQEGFIAARSIGPYCHRHPSLVQEDSGPYLRKTKNQISKKVYAISVQRPEMQCGIPAVGLWTPRFPNPAVRADKFFNLSPVLSNKSHSESQAFS